MGGRKVKERGGGQLGCIKPLRLSGEGRMVVANLSFLRFMSDNVYVLVGPYE